MGRAGRELGQQVLIEYLPKQRWFSAKNRTLKGVRVAGSSEFSVGGRNYLLSELDVDFAEAPDNAIFCRWRSLGVRKI